MTTERVRISPDRTLAEIAVETAAAARVFHRHQLDYCCGGQVALADACAKAGLETASVIEELEQEVGLNSGDAGLDELDIPQLIDHIFRRFHEPHREEVPRLLAMAEKVERVHAEKESCPHGLAAHLRRMHEELEAHMQKEEQVLFPLLLDGRGRLAHMPIKAMEDEHRDHGRNLDELVRLAQGFVAPDEACPTWRALYLGLDQLQQDLMEHIHIENNLLFPMALRD